MTTRVERIPWGRPHAEDLTPTASPLGATAAEPAVATLSPPGYELLEEMGQADMGVVYRARDTALARCRRQAALRRLPGRLAGRDTPSSPKAHHRQLQHPGIPAVHQVGSLGNGRPFLAMRLIKGRTLEAILKQRRDPSAERGRLLAIFEAVCHAVGYAHAHRVIHRDLKPANVMVGAFGEVQVLDWGLAKVLGKEDPATAEALAADQTRPGRRSLRRQRPGRTRRPAAWSAPPRSSRGRRWARSTRSTSVPMCSGWVPCSLRF